MAKTRITSVLLPSGWSTVSDCTVDDGIWTCRVGPYQQVVIKEDHIYACRECGASVSFMVRSLIHEWLEARRSQGVDDV